MIRLKVRPHTADRPATHRFVADQSDKPRASVLCVLSLSAITRTISDEVQMKMSWQCLATIGLPTDYSDHNPTSTMVNFKQWNVSGQYLTKLFGHEKSAFQPASCQPPASVEVGYYAIMKRDAINPLKRSMAIIFSVDSRPTVTGATL